MNFNNKNCKGFIEIKSTKQDIDEILNWLKVEKEHDGASFYNNKNIIDKAFEKGETIVLKDGEKNIGLLVWGKTNKICANIDIFVIHPDYRRQGFGRFFYNEILKFFRMQEFKVTQLFCEPQTSESFWKKMDLIKFPECEVGEHELTYYKILVDTALVENNSTNDKIELWDVDHYQAEDKEPKWTWYIEMDNGVLLNPIIHPCNCNWRLRWSRNNQVIREEKVKYFTSNTMELYDFPFLHITELKE